MSNLTPHDRAFLMRLARAVDDGSVSEEDARKAYQSIISKYNISRLDTSNRAAPEMTSGGSGGWLGMLRDLLSSLFD